MVERGVSLEDAKTVVEKSEPFEYIHEGLIKTGYYDTKNKIFIGEYKGNVTTIMTNVKPQYVEKLKETKQ